LRALEAIHVNPETVQEKLAAFLSPTAVVESGTKPTLAAYYADHFKLVDNFNALAALIQWPYRINKVEFVWFINSIIMFVVNTWTLWTDTYLATVGEDSKESLKEFVAKLVDELLE
jgi:hypothetical protein